MDLIEEAAKLSKEQSTEAAEGQQQVENATGNAQEQQNNLDATKVFEYFDNNKSDLYAYLSKEAGKEVASLDDLTKIEYKEKEVELPEDVKKYWEFKQETGGSFEDFLGSQKDWKSESKETVVRESLRQKEGYDGELLDDIFDNDYKITEDDSEADARKKRINMEKAYREGLKFLEEKRQKYTMPKQEVEAQRIASQEMEARRNEFANGMVKAIEEIRELKVGESIYKLQEDAKIKEDFKSVDGIMNRFKKADGSMDYGKLYTTLRIADNLESIVNTEYDARFSKYIQEQEKKLTNSNVQGTQSNAGGDDFVAQARKAFGL